MKILVVQESDWLERNPHQQHHLMDRMSLRGHEIKVIDYPIDWRLNEKECLLYNRKVFKDVYKINENARVEVIRPKFIKLPVLSYISLVFSHKKEIDSQIKEFKPDVVIALGILNAYSAYKIAKKHKIPFVYYLIDVVYKLIPEKSFQFFGKFINQKTLIGADLVLAINKRLGEFGEELGVSKDKIDIIDAGIDLKEFNPDLSSFNIRKEYGISDDDYVLFFMGWIYSFSGMAELAVELGKSKEKYPKLKIVIVGDGDDYNKLQKIKEDYNLANQLILTGKQPYTKIPEFLAMADFCLLPAHIDEEIMQDIVPIKLYEYLAMKKVVIATKLPGIYKEFGDDHGIEYVNKAEEVLDTVTKIINNNSYEEIAIAGRNYVQSNDWEKITDNFENTLENLIKTYRYNEKNK